jgi:hypothetical protein
MSNKKFDCPLCKKSFINSKQLLDHSYNNCDRIKNSGLTRKNIYLSYINDYLMHINDAVNRNINLDFDLMEKSESSILFDSEIGIEVDLKTNLNLKNELSDEDDEEYNENFQVSDLEFKTKYKINTSIKRISGLVDFDNLNYNLDYINEFEFNFKKYKKYLNNGQQGHANFIYEVLLYDVEIINGKRKKVKKKVDEISVQYHDKSRNSYSYYKNGEWVENTGTNICMEMMEKIRERYYITNTCYLNAFNKKQTKLGEGNSYYMNLYKKHLNELEKTFKTQYCKTIFGLVGQMLRDNKNKEFFEKIKKKEEEKAKKRAKKRAK